MVEMKSTAMSVRERVEVGRRNVGHIHAPCAQKARQGAQIEPV